MSDREWLDAFDERLEDVTERWMLARWADFTHEKGDLDPDRELRRAASLAFEPLGEWVTPLVQRLARLRNDRSGRLVSPISWGCGCTSTGSVCAPGNLVDWDVKIERLTGRPLSADTWVRELETEAAL